MVFSLTVVNSSSCKTSRLVAVGRRRRFPGLVGRRGRWSNGGFGGSTLGPILVRRGITVIVVRSLALDPVLLDAGVGGIVVDPIGPVGTGGGKRRRTGHGSLQLGWLDRAGLGSRTGQRRQLFKGDVIWL